MKRSEMIKAMATEIVLANHKITFDKAQDMADKILERQESEGMIPPFNYDSWYLDGDNADRRYVIYYEWHKENEWCVKDETK